MIILLFENGYTVQVNVFYFQIFQLIFCTWELINFSEHFC